MKIAALAPGYNESDGGGHTFERSLLTALAIYAHDSPINIAAVVSTRPCPSWWPAHTACQWLHMPTTGLAKVQVAPRVITSYLLGRSVQQSIRDGHAHHIDRFLARHGFDLVWQLTPGMPPLDIPYVATLWDLQHRLQPWFPETSANGEWWNRETYFSEWLNRAMRIIVPNTILREEVVHFYGIPEHRCAIIGHPVDPFPEYIEKRTQLPNAAASFDILYPAQYWPHKNHVCLLAALCHLHRTEDPRWRLILTGSDKGNAAYIKSEAARLGVLHAVEFHGFVAREKLVDHYRSCFALAFPSFFGPENLPPMEAMSFGCPAIVADVPGAHEQYGDAVLLFDPSDPFSLAHCVSRLKHEPELRCQLVSRTRQIIEARSPESFVRQSMAMIRSCLAPRLAWKNSAGINVL